jgi:hypothetical protein
MVVSIGCVEIIVNGSVKLLQQVTPLSSLVIFVTTILLFDFGIERITFPILSYGRRSKGSCTVIVLSFHHLRNNDAGRVLFLPLQQWHLLR